MPEMALMVIAQRGIARIRIAPDPARRSGVGPQQDIGQQPERASLQGHEPVVTPHYRKGTQPAYTAVSLAYKRHSVGQIGYGGMRNHRHWPGSRFEVAPTIV